MDKLAPYRIEWRSNLVTSWMYLQSAQTHDEALELMRRQHVKFKGQVRVVVQHVIETVGLGS